MTKTLIPAQRRQRIRDYLAEHQVAPIAALSQWLQVSEATVRRDLEWLENEGILERTHGGAALSHRLPNEPAYTNSAQAHPDEKRSIGAAAAALVEDGDTLFVNSGTTTTQVIRHLRNVKHVTVVTNNVRAALEARGSGVELILLGGAFRARANSVAGRFAVEMLRQIYATKTFIGVDGISLKYGCTTPNDSEAEIARLMIERTRGPVIVVADHSKWDVVSNYEIARIDQIHKLITDEGLERLPHARAELAEHSVEVVIARGESNGRVRAKDLAL
ncbi:MAG: DeoR/GlpR family DNA-binding transcription regulator [Anaerolineales bacterium]